MADRAQDKAPGTNYHLPDEVLYLADPSDGGSYLLHRWYHMKREEIDGAVAERKAKELEAKLKKEAEEEAERK